jgi:hypothetical protein
MLPGMPVRVIDMSVASLLAGTGPARPGTQTASQGTLTPWSSPQSLQPPISDPTNTDDMSNIIVDACPALITVAAANRARSVTKRKRAFLMRSM